MPELSKEALTSEGKRGLSGHGFFALPPRLVISDWLRIGTGSASPSSKRKKSSIQFSLDSLHRKIRQLDRIKISGFLGNKVANCAKNCRLEDLDRIAIVDAPVEKLVLGQIAQQIYHRATDIGRRRDELDILCSENRRGITMAEWNAKLERALGPQSVVRFHHKVRDLQVWIKR